MPFNKTLLILLGTMCMLIPALYNQFPLMNPDDGTYISSGFQLYTPVDRPIVYGVLLRILSLNGLSMWLPTIIQCGIVAYLIAILLESYSSKKHYHRNLGITYLVLSLTSLPWATSQLIPDIWIGIAILSALVILLRRPISIKKYIALLFIFFCAVATHMSNIMIIIGLLVVALFVSKLIKLKHQQSNIYKNLGLLTIIALSTLVFMGKMMSRSRHVFNMASLVEKGLLPTYLEETCAIKKWGICAYKDNMTTDPNVFIWDMKSPLYLQGGWEATKSEYSAIVKDFYSIPKFRNEFIKASFTYSYRQLFVCYIGEGNRPLIDDDNVKDQVEKYFPNDYNRFLTAKQQTYNIIPTLSSISIVNSIIFVISMIVILILILIGYKTIPKQLIFIALLMVIGYVINVYACATFAQVNARYSSRLMWIVPIAALMLLFAYNKSKLSYQKN